MAYVIDLILISLATQICNCKDPTFNEVAPSVGRNTVNKNPASNNWSATPPPSQKKMAKCTRGVLALPTMR